MSAMKRLRRALGPVAAAWLLCQAATLVVVPAVFHAGSTTAPIECTCVHDGNHSRCPMHHKSPAGAKVCFQTTESTGLAVLSSSLGHVGLVPGALWTFTFIRPSLVVRFDETSKTLRPAPPDPPPPRA